MTAYKIPIESAIIIFPLVAFFLTLPYLIYQYRKYGSIPIIRSIIFYSFILYLISAYFLVILPLPTMESVKKITSPTMQLHPFNFVSQLMSTTHVSVTSIKSIVQLFKNPNVYVALFNLFLTVPFGFFLKYYLGYKWYKILLYTFILSLFFELTQVSGLYGIYPHPYRLFDIDDLILNTVGGLLGYWLTPVALLILPSRQEIDKKSYQKGKQVTILRRIITFCIDFFFLVIMILVVKTISYNCSIDKYAFLFSLTIYYIIIPIITKGQTIGKIILKLKLISTIKPEITRVQIASRCFFEYILFYYQATLINIINPFTKHSNYLIAIAIQFMIVSLIIYNLLNIGSILLSIFKKEKIFLYEKISNTKNVSTITYHINQKEKTENKKHTQKGEFNVRNQENKQEL